MSFFLTVFWWFAVNSRNSRFGGFNSRLGFPFSLLRKFAPNAFIGSLFPMRKWHLSATIGNSRFNGNNREPCYGGSFDMMIVPEAANMPPTPWQTLILAPGTWAGAMPRIWRTLSCKAYMPYMPECM